MVDATEKLIRRYETLIVATLEELVKTNNSAEIQKLGDKLIKLTYTFTDLSIIAREGGKIYLPEEALAKFNLAD